MPRQAELTVKPFDAKHSHLLDRRFPVINYWPVNSRQRRWCILLKGSALVTPRVRN